MNDTYITHNFEETQRLGEEFVHWLKPGDVVVLYGDLGAGKTTFMQGLAKGLGIIHRIISPTFIIMRKYDVTFLSSRAKQNEVERSTQEISPRFGTSFPKAADSVGNDIKRLYHIDLYRTETMEDLQGIGLLEILKDTEAVIAIEWPEKMRELLPKNRWEIRFKWLNENEREITIKKF